MKKLLIIPLVIVAAFALLLFTGGDEGLPTNNREPLPSTLATTDIPADYLTAYRNAGRLYQIPWTYIAAIGKVECDHGRNQLPGCNPTGTVNPVGARGPMQFLGSTWNATKTALDPDIDGPPIPDGNESAGYATDCDSDGVADPWNIRDAACATARMLKHNGAPGDIDAALYAYNHADWYVTRVKDTATTYDAGPALAGLVGYQPDGGWPLPATTGKISYFGDTTECQPMALWPQWGSRASCTMDNDPTLRWYVAMRWAQPGSSYPWWRNQRIAITNTRTNRTVIVVAGDWGPAQWTNRVVDVSAPVMNALAAKTDDQVTITLAPPSTPTGPYTGTTTTPTTPTANSGLATVQFPKDKITVAATLAPRMSALAVAAHRANIPLGGWGWRSTQRQIELRSEPSRGCGDGPPLSYYDIYQAPSNTCTPPTAPPGRSQHERGLAIDFTCSGNTVRHGDQCWNWLRNHAATYGLTNLPSESWHWSTSGK